MSNENLVLPRFTGTKSVRSSAEFLPIRSVYYRKKLPTKLDPIQLQQVSTESTMPTISPQMSNEIPVIDFGTTQETTDKQTVISSRPTTFRTTFHLFSTTARNRKKKQFQSIELNGTSQRTLFSKSTTLASTKPTNSDTQFTVRDFIIEMQKVQPQKNYFSDEIYEHYNSEEVINNPMRFTKYDQLSDPNKYMKRNIFQQVQIPKEIEIRATNRLRFSESIEEHENENTLAIHFLGAAEHNIKHLEDSLKVLMKGMEIFKKEKKRLKEEMKDLGESDERIRGELVHNIRSGVRKFEDSLKESALENHNYKIRLTKDLVYLQRDKINLEKGVQEGLERLQNTETKLLGFEAFDLQAEDRNLETISLQNLRSDMQSSMTNRPIIH